MGSCVSTPVSGLPAPSGPQPGCSPCWSLGTCPHATSGHWHRAWPRPVSAVPGMCSVLPFARDGLECAGSGCRQSCLTLTPLPDPHPSSKGLSRVKVLQVAQSRGGCGEWSRQGMELAGSTWQCLAGQCLLSLSLCATPGASPAAARAWISPRVVAGSLHYHQASGGPGKCPHTCQSPHVAVSSGREVPHNKLSSGPLP